MGFQWGQNVFLKKKQKRIHHVFIRFFFVSMITLKKTNKQKKTNSFAAVVRFPRWRRTCVERGKKKRGTWKKKRGTWLFAEIPLNGPHLHFQFSFLAAVSNDSVTHLISRRYALRPRLLTGFRWDPPFCFSFSFFFSSLYSFLFSRFFSEIGVRLSLPTTGSYCFHPNFFFGGGGWGRFYWGWVQFRKYLLGFCGFRLAVMGLGRFGWVGLGFQNV